MRHRFLRAGAVAALLAFTALPALAQGLGGGAGWTFGIKPLQWRKTGASYGTVQGGKRRFNGVTGAQVTTSVDSLVSHQGGLIYRPDTTEAFTLQSLPDYFPGAHRATSGALADSLFGLRLQVLPVVDGWGLSTSGGLTLATDSVFVTTQMSTNGGATWLAAQSAITVLEQTSQDWYDMVFNVQNPMVIETVTLSPVNFLGYNQTYRFIINQNDASGTFTAQIVYPKLIR